MKKYAIIITDEFGGEKIKVIETNNIDNVLYREFMKLKRKAVMADEWDEKRKPFGKLYNTRKILLKDEFSFFSDKLQKVKYLKQNKTYFCYLKRGYTLEYKITYKELSKNDTHILKTYYHNDCLGGSRFYIGSKKELTKKARSLLIKNRESKQDKIAIKKGKDTQLTTSGYYKCSYEYNEYDEYINVATIKKIKVKKVMR